MHALRPHLHIARRVIISNVWLLEDGFGRRFVVDTGHMLERYTLKKSLWDAGIRAKGDVTAILLTHRHSDHAGNAGYLRELLDAPVVCHQDDAPFLDGTAAPARLARGGANLYEEALSHVEDTFPARSTVDEAVAEGAWKHGLRFHHVPGHTDGSVLIHHEPTGTLFSGDAILTGIPAIPLLEKLRLAVPGFSLDVERCHARVREVVAQLPAVTAVAAGHGPAVLREATRKLARLVAG
jgi:glyoxylase-like metal-dependent hydrolase (beta-lactamase superfamily II)